MSKSGLLSSQLCMRSAGVSIRSLADFSPKTNLDSLLRTHKLTISKHLEVGESAGPANVPVTPLTAASIAALGSSSRPKRAGEDASAPKTSGEPKLAAAVLLASDSKRMGMGRGKHEYPTDNCAAAFNTGVPIIDPQTVFPEFLNHTVHTSLLAQYLSSTAFAQSKGKKILMFETNTTVGPVYYSALVAAEAIRPSNKTQILDLQANGNIEFTPAYGIYENGNPVGVGLFNYITDASDVTAVISIDGGNTTPTQVKVKYLTATSVAQKGGYTWAGQTFGGNFESDGRLQGTKDVQTVQCDTMAKTCSVKVPPPGFALVFLSDSSQTEIGTDNTATIATSVLATSNGHGGKDDPLNFQNELRSTSRGSKKGGAVWLRPAAALLVTASSLAIGAMLVGRALVR
ncbi:hypothetical protein B0H13DRAFT_2400859 [Mycena leptocephala]|nr:hypothetical protein B0H13DRAFT_2400859 [Mycena leptocephala]